jgi:prevent-host-death family protein
METIAISEFRARLPEFLGKVEAGETIKLTVRGKEVARLTPPKQAQKEARQRIAQLRKTAWVGDVVSPLGESPHTEP